MLSAFMVACSFAVYPFRKTDFSRVRRLFQSPLIHQFRV